MRNAEFDYAEARAKAYGVSLRKCPVCGQRTDTLTLERRKDHDCEFEAQLVFHLFARNVPPRAWRFDWQIRQETDLTHVADTYVDHLAECITDGFSLVMVSDKRGAGKTTAAHRILVEAGRQGYSVYTCRFDDLLELHEREEGQQIRDWLTRRHLVFVDEVKVPHSDAARSLYEQKMDRLIDERYAASRPNIIAGNISLEQFEEAYESAYSRLDETALFPEVPNITLRPRARRDRFARANLDNNGGKAI